ncbi:MAG: UDP-N-acetylmuramate dehydrogenase [Frankiales bacterium]|nr:UDP-N-acetylmuramate dehydrogenase [Frankiales bacterium]
MPSHTDVPLAPLTSLRLGGPARSLVVCESAADLVEAVRARPCALVLGGGSNVVLPDEGLDEVVLVRNRGVSGLELQAGEDWDEVVRLSLEQGYVGLEALSGIPGTVGASPIQNIGAYGAELASCILSVRAFDRESGAEVVLPAAACGFAYRHSVFKASPGRWVVLSVQLALSQGRLSAPVRYAELADCLGVALGDRAPAADVREAVLALRRRKGMVLDPSDADSVSAGSFFTNPLVPMAPAGAPSWPDPSGLVKVSAAWLIENSGFGKGWGEGPIGLSSKHTLALVNRGGGTTAELLAVARAVRDGVQSTFGITLVNEPVIVGGEL